jgi:hypothetical protein
MDPELKLHINETGKFRSEYLTCVIQNLGKLDSYKDFIFNNINKSISARVQKLQNLKSRINRIRAILPKLSECNHAMTIKSKKYYPINKHNYYQYIHLEDRPEEINNLINTIYNVNNPNIPKTNIKRPLVDKGEKGNLGKIPRESFDDYISYQLLSNMQKTVKDLASELCDLRFKNIGTSLVNELNDLVYEKTQYLETNFGFINKNLIQKAGLLWKVNKDEFDFKSNLNAIQMKNDEEDEEPQFAKKSSKKLSLKLQEAPKSIVSKVKIEKYVNKKILLEKTREKTEFNLPTSINLGGVAELKDETAVEETPNIDENIYPEREDLDFDFDNPTDINNINFDDDFDIVDIMMKRKNNDNAKNENANMTPTPNYNYQSANTSNINNVQSTMNLNVNNNLNSASNAPVSSTVSTGNIVVVSGSGPGVPPPPPPPPPPPSVPVIKAPPKKPAKAKKEEEGEENQEEKQEPVKEISMAEQLAMVKLKKVGTVKAKEVEEPKKPINHNDLLKQQILLRFKNLRMHEKENENNDSDSEEEDDE